MYWEWRYSTTHLTLAVRGGEWSAYIPWLLYPQGKSSCYPFDRRLGEPQSQCGCSGEKKKSLLLPGNKP